MLRIIVFVLPFVFMNTSFGVGLALHDIHVSTTEILWNKDDIQVTARIFTDDLLNALVKRFKLKEVPESKAKSYELVQIYLSETLVIKSKGEVIPLQLKSLEPWQDAMWCELSLEKSNLDGQMAITIENRILFELFKDQLNILQINKGDLKKVLTFDHKKNVHKVRFTH